jgi:hypothetical protein
MPYFLLTFSHKRVIEKQKKQNSRFPVNGKKKDVYIHFSDICFSPIDASIPSSITSPIPLEKE